MAVTSTAIFIQTPKVAVQSLVTANTNRDGTGTIATIYTAGTNGSRIDHIDIQSYGTVTAGVIRLYIHDGSTAMLWKELLVTATTPSATIAAWSATVDCSQPQNICVMPTTYSLRGSTHNTENFRVLAWGGDY